MAELQQFFRALQQPEYVHVLLNPLPVYGLAMGLLALLLSLIYHSSAGKIVALVIIIVSCVVVWPTAMYGHQGFDRVYSMADSAGQKWLELHAQRASRVVYVFYLNALLAAVALVCEWKFPKFATHLSLATLLLTLVALGLGGAVSHAGGQVRHKEFRDGPPPAMKSK